jgi:hypothetical protein
LPIPSTSYFASAILHIQDRITSKIGVEKVLRPITLAPAPASDAVISVS